MKGLIFGIEEFSTRYGPGVRTAVILKGCPMHCAWCNDTGVQSFLPIKIKECEYNCITETNSHPEVFVPQGSCVTSGAQDPIRIIGKENDAGVLAEKIQTNADVYKTTRGGVTLTGGEPLLQHKFVFELLEGLSGIHRAVETGGFAEPEIFERTIDHTEMILFNLKTLNSELHQKYTGVSNTRILKNLGILKNSGQPFIVRIPLIPTINDSPAFYEEIINVLQGSKNLSHIEIMTIQQSPFFFKDKAQHPFDKSKVPYSIFEQNGIQTKFVDM